MADFKLTISDPKTGKTVQKEVKDEAAAQFINLKIGDSIKGDGLGMLGYEFLVTGGSDKCGFPMRKGIQVARKKMMAAGGVGFRGKNRGKKQAGVYLKKTVCGDRIKDSISHINLKVTNQGKSNLFEEKKEEAEAQKAESKEPPKKEEKAKEEPKKKEEKAEAPKKEEKPSKEEAKPTGKKQEAPKEEKKE